jgi:hypothetical protein
MMIVPRFAPIAGVTFAADSSKHIASQAGRLQELLTAYRFDAEKEISVIFSVDAAARDHLRWRRQQTKVEK